MRFLFQSCDDSVKTLNIGGANAMDNGSFQCGQMTLDALSQLAPFCGWFHDEGATICFAHRARNQPARCQSIENAR
jgi:hypothetical protein